MLVREIMSQHPVTTTPDASVREALVVLAEHRVTALPVLDRGGRLVGIVSEGDLIRHVVNEDPRAHERPVTTEHEERPLVADIMSPLPIVVRPAADVASAVRLMTTRSFKSLPVVDDADRLVGVLSRSDVVRAVARPDDEVAHEIEVHLAEAGLGHWTAEVDDGSVRLVGPDDDGDRALAHLVAATVPGVLEVVPS